MDTQEESTFIQLFNLSGRRYSIKYDRGSPQHGWIFYDNHGFCGQEYPIGTPTHGSEILTEHIKVCERHPLRKAESDVAMLRAALAGLIGADSEQELRQMETTMRLLPAPDADKAVSINAIHALLATMTPNAELRGRPLADGPA